MTIYLDILFFVNVAVNTAILWLTSRLLKLNTSALRFILAIAIMSGYGVLVCFPVFGFLLNILIKIFFACLITLTAFKFKSIKGYIKTLFIFLAVSFSYIALLISFSYIPILSDIIYIRNGNVYYNLPLPYVLIMTIVLCATQLILSRFFDKRLPKNSVIPCSILFNGKKADLNCFVDSGNMLREQLSGLPVVIVEKNALKNIIEMDSTGNLRCEECDDLYTKYRLVPYRGAGGSTGLLEAFRPDKFLASEKEYNVIIAVNKSPINKDGLYEGIIPILN